MIKNKMNTKLKKGIFSAVAVVVLIAAVIAVNIFVTSKNYTVDVTANKIYSLSKQTKKILKGLDKEVTIYVIDKESSVNSSYAQVWKEYKKNSTKVKFVYKDPDLYPNFTKKYTDSSEEVANDSMIIKCGKKYRYVSANDYVSYSYGSDYSYSADSLQLESLTTEAINYVVSDSTPVIYTLSGHSEQSFDTSVTSSFEGDNYSVKTLNLLTEQRVPDDCSILLINGAQKDITKDELKMIKKYMKNGGKMYVFLDAKVENLTNLYSLLKSYNVEPQKGVVVETDASKYTQYPIYLLPTIESSDATSAQYNSNIYILAPSAKGLKDITEKNAKKNSSASDYTVTSLLSTSDGAYSKVNTDSATLNKEKNDISGPFNISVAVSDSTGGRMIVTGCTNMLLQDIDQAVSGANTDFVLNGVNYLAEQKSKISIRAKSLKTENAVVPAFNQKATLIMTLFVIPLVILAIGIGIVIKRRKL